MWPMPVAQKPDPARGVFDTMLVVRGEPILLEAHLTRLEASLAAVYAASLPAEARHLLAQRAVGLGLGRARVTVRPGGPNGLEVEVEASEIDPSLQFPSRSVSLRSHPVAGGLGCHKWVDRAAIPTPDRGEEPLLVDHGEVLEAGRANVFAVRNGALFTPPLDGRILPGVTRATVIELARAEGVEVVEARLAVGELGEAEEVFLTNSLRGLERVGALDGKQLGDGGSPVARLTAALRARWRLVSPAAHAG
jgi:para-aminobenzoate synthetase / 4-amino-4-deoxychorismate lyase